MNDYLYFVKYRSPKCSSSIVPGYLKSIWSKEYTVRSERFSLRSTPINTQTFSTPSPPRKIRPKSEQPTSALSTSDILNMYIPTSSKTPSSVEYHTSIIQSIEIVKRPLVFNEHDNDTSSRFFSSTTTVTKTSVFDAINENENILANKETISPKNKRFKRSNTDKQNEEDHSSHVTIQSSIETFLTPSKENRVVLKRQSPNIENDHKHV